VLGGRAGHWQGTLPTIPAMLDNGQHISDRAYSETLRLMRLVGVDAGSGPARLPAHTAVSRRGGLQFPSWPSGIDALGGSGCTRLEHA